MSLCQLSLRPAKQQVNSIQMFDMAELSATCCHTLVVMHMSAEQEMHAVGSGFSKAVAHLKVDPTLLHFVRTIYLKHLAYFAPQPLAPCNPSVLKWTVHT